MFNVSELTVGQEVAVVRQSSGFYSFASATYATVEKINKFGHITLSDGQKFDKRGNEYKVEYGRKYLANADEIRAHITRQNADRAQQQEISRILADIEKTVRNHKNGYGRVFINAETKEQLVSLINQLPVTE